jgi:hypothetical protein
MNARVSYAMYPLICFVVGLNIGKRCHDWGTSLVLQPTVFLKALTAEAFPYCCIVF